MIEWSGWTVHRSGGVLMAGLADGSSAGAVVSGYRWDGTEWVPVPGAVVSGYRWDETEWVPVPEAGPSPGSASPVAPRPSPRRWSRWWWVGVAVVGAVGMSVLGRFAMPAVDEPALTRTATTPTIQLEYGPDSVAVDPQAQRAYVTHQYSGAVSVIDTTTNTVTDIIEVQDGPWGVAVDPQAHRAYVTNELSDSVSVIDTTTNMVTATIGVGDNPRGVAVDPQAHRAYVTNELSDSVSVIDG